MTVPVRWPVAAIRSARRRFVSSPCCVSWSRRLLARRRRSDRGERRWWGFSPVIHHGELHSKSNRLLLGELHLLLVSLSLALLFFFLALDFCEAILEGSSLLIFVELPELFLLAKRLSLQSIVLCILFGFAYSVGCYAAYSFLCRLFVLFEFP